MGNKNRIDTTIVVTYIDTQNECAIKPIYTRARGAKKDENGIERLETEDERPKLTVKEVLVNSLLKRQEHDTSINILSRTQLAQNIASKKVVIINAPGIKMLKELVADNYTPPIPKDSTELQKAEILSSSSTVIVSFVHQYLDEISGTTSKIETWEVEDDTSEEEATN